MTSPGSAASDRTVNKVALCSAIFAGVAYVGYTVVRKAFGRRTENTKRDDVLDRYRPSGGRVYLRRLSGSEASTSTEALLGTLEQDGQAARLILRPLSVQERIRELNLRARHFAETVLAVQLYSPTSPGDARRAIGHTRSLQTSPTRSSPRILSPIDITHLGSSRCSSIENLSLSAGGGANHNNGCYGSLKRRSSRRRSLKMRSPDSGNFSRGDDEAMSEAGARLLEERELELRRRLQGLEEGTTKILTPFEAKSLVALLHTKEKDTLERALVTVSNSAAFTANQDNLREAGCLSRLQRLIVHEDPGVRRAAVTAVGNMALSTANQKELGQVVPLLLPTLENDLDWRPTSPPFAADRDLLICQTLLTLTNMAVLSIWHQQFCGGGTLSKIFELTVSDNPKIRMQALRLLVNLSTNEEMVPHLLAAKAPDYVWNLLDDGQAEDELLRVVTLLSNLVCSMAKANKNNNDAKQIPIDAETPEKDTMFSQIFGDENSDDVLDQLVYLARNHPHEDIRVKARMVHAVMEKVVESERLL